MAKRKWGGSVAVRARKHFTPLVAEGIDCHRCGLPINPAHADTDLWHVGHLDDRALGGSDTNLARMAPEHATCNLSAGGRLAAALGVGVHAGRAPKTRKPPPLVTVPVVTRRDW